MKRIASLCTAAALSGALLGVGSASRAASNIIALYLTPVSPLNVTYQPGDAISFAAMIDIPATGPGPITLTIGVGIGYDSNVFAINGIGNTPDNSSYPTNPGPRLWDLLPPPSYTSLPNGLAAYQQAVGHTKHITQPGNKTVTLVGGTYTVTTFTFPVLASAPAGPTDVLFPSVYYTLGVPTSASDFINNTDAAGTNDEVLTFPNTGGKYSKLTYNIKVGSGNTPAPSALLTLALGAAPLIGRLCRRRKR